jgi:hypothetical protein
MDLGFPRVCGRWPDTKILDTSLYFWVWAAAGKCRWPWESITNMSFSGLGAKTNNLLMDLGFPRVCGWWPGTKIFDTSLYFWGWAAAGMSSRIFVCFLCFVVGRRPGPRYCRWTIRSKDFQNAFRPRPKISMLGLDCYGPCGGTKQICVSSAQHSPLDYLRTYFGETDDLLSDERIFSVPKKRF